MQGRHDKFEQQYTARLDALLCTAGVPVAYAQDRAALDTGLHLFVEGPGGDRAATQVRVWFQAKGKRAKTLTAAAFAGAPDVAVQVDVDHLRFWYAAPEAVYLVIYIESADLFLAEDVRDIVRRQWPNHDFYAATAEQATATVRVDTAAVLGEARLASMLSHRSMRIDGATFQGRPLGHHLDPVRCELSFDRPGLWERAVTRVLDEHRFDRRARTVTISDGLAVVRGRFYDTMLWQSSAFAEFGYGPDDDLRDDPAVEFVQGPAHVVVDSTPNRRALMDHERAGLLDELGAGDDPVVLFFHGKDLSGTGGTWRSFLRDGTARHRPVRMIGTEALTGLVLTATLVYLDLAPELSFRTVNYR